MIKHSALTMVFEKALQSISPGVTCPYWDYTIEGEKLRGGAQASDVWLQSGLLEPTAFGLVNDTVPFVVEGVWAFTRIGYDTDSSAVHNAYGYTRAPWNTNAVRQILPLYRAPVR